MNRIDIFTEIQPGERFPRFYGWVYTNFERQVQIVCPIPLNLLIASLRKIYYRLLRGLAPSCYDKAIKEAKIKFQDVFLDRERRIRERVHKDKKEWYDMGYQAGVNDAWRKYASSGGKKRDGLETGSTEKP